MRLLGEHAVVLGAGMAGLLAARVLTDAYQRVTIVERDAPQDSGPRKGVPQGRHAHVLLPRGQQILEELLPGLVDELIARGAVTADPGTEHRFILGGHTIRRVKTDYVAVQASRPLLETTVRERVCALTGVGFASERDAVGLIAPESGRITAARSVGREAGSAAEDLLCDLVVDATGRSGRTQAWLGQLGYDQAPQEEVRVDVAYASHYLRLPPDAFPDKAVIVGARAGLPHAMALLAVEGEHHLLSLAGIGSEHRPPTDPDGFLAFADTIAPPDVAKAIWAAEPLTDIVPFRYPSELRRRYERLRRFPAGLLVIGDALCSFNPVYGQGMTVAAMEALVLRRCLADGPDGLARRYYRAAAKAVNDPWQLATTADLALPGVQGRRSPATRLVNAYAQRVQAVAAQDVLVAEQFLRVAGLIDPPPRLMRPAILSRVLRGASRESG